MSCCSPPRWRSGAPGRTLTAAAADAEARTFDDSTASIELTLKIHDLKHLEKVVKSIRGVAGVIEIERQAVPR